jgi:hypothetical protein
MKKFLVWIVIVMMIGVLSYSQTITVTNPHAGTVFHKGQTYTITWTNNGNTGINVKINIFKGSIKQTNFKLQLKGPNTGLMQWKIPANFATGAYILRIKGVDAKGNGTGIKGDSSLFRVIGLSRSSIIVTRPNSGESIYKGENYTIKWTSSNIPLKSNIIINIFKDSINPANFKQKLTCTNSHSKQWFVPKDFKDGKYYIRIKTTDNSTHGDSKMFNIQASGGLLVPINGKKNKSIEINPPGTQNFTNHYIKVVFPKKGDIVYSGKKMSIRWIFKGFSNNNLVDIYLVPKEKSNSKEYIIIKNTPIAARIYGFKLNSQIPAGEYFPVVDIHPKAGAGVLDPSKISDPPLHSGSFTIKKRKSGDLQVIDSGVMQTEQVSIIQPQIQNDSNIFNRGGLYIKKFKAVPSLIEPEIDSLITFDYKNVLSAKIENVNTGKIIKVLGTQSSQKGVHAVWPKETTTYRLIVNTNEGKHTAETKVVVKKELKIEYFRAFETSYNVGDKVEFYYEFKGADYATISDSETNHILKYIPLQGKYNVAGRVDLTFKHPVKYVLTISSNNGKNVRRSPFSTYVKRETKLKQGINQLDIIANWRFSEMHIDLLIDVFGAKSISIFLHNKKTGKKLRIYHSEPASYGRKKYEAKPYRKLPSKDFSKIYYFTYRVVFWDGQIINKTVTF